MHYLKVKTCGPVGVFFSKKVHTQIYTESAESSKQKPGFCFEENKKGFPGCGKPFSNWVNY